jgi:hypothetical protein
MKYLILFTIMILCSSGTEQLYRSIVPGCPVGGGKVLGGVYQESNASVEQHLESEGKLKVSQGLAIVAISIVVSVCFANPMTGKICNYSLIGGATWFLNGILDMFVAKHIVLISWIAVLGVIFIILYKCKDHSIFKSIKAEIEN